MNNNDLNQLSNELLTAYFDKLEAGALLSIANKYGLPIDGKIFKKAIDRTISWLDGKNDIDAMNQENKSRMFHQGLQNISQKYDAVLGRDFSKTSDGLLMSNELLNKIMGDMPPEAIEEFKTKGFLKSLEQDPFKMLETSLGVPFFDSLEGLVKLRLLTLSDCQAGSYLGSLVGGLQNKHFWISDEWILYFFVRVAGKERWDRIANAESIDDTEPDGMVFDDLLTALGIIDRREDPELGFVIGIDDIMALDKVFRGENMSCAEMAEHLRRYQDTHRNK